MLEVAQGIIVVVIILYAFFYAKSENSKKGKKKKATPVVQSAISNAIVHGHDHFGDARTEDKIHSTLDAAKDTGLINLNGKLYTKDQLRGI